MADDAPFLSETDREALLDLAEETVRHTVAGKGAEAIACADQAVGPQLKAGAFVSLHRQGRLRGCIGTFDTTRPVAGQVKEMAVAAASRDPRFPPVGPGEVADLEIEISVLTPPRLVEDPDEITVGVHGIVISKGHKRGVLLPQVATDYNWDRTTFLEHTCVKAGLDQNAWKDPGTQIEVFSAEVFGKR